ncbi:coiled-coil domain-containing protein 134 [Tribolium castaneum]|uniref:Coiled-coil domain-containing protein 134-like Protein n=1 Tax=Tribolium castaneum TaxID=7070 RepID=D2A2K2_TRICA|nr:PREDICTED: coiled-coil domain-containing protein 134 [Tribolium castaneum]EFA02212.2 Coiled-coil domain-containing protein 134-like Protein [Tribolium castaneum]|eukprot:XP_008191788.1 PREDICTED: coiled-coil domain-containing protein 134 [Tribolium castaneum]
MKIKTIILVLFVVNFSFAQSNEAEIAEQIYKKLFKRQRAEQLEAIKSFRKISSYEKQYSMIMLMAEKVFTVIQDSRATIEASPYIPGVSDFPLDDRIKDALSNILENTALFSDIILRFPDISISVLKTNNNWDVLLQWSIAFCNQVRYLLDNSTIKAMSFASQELNHVERNPNYFNPYRKQGPELDQEGNPSKAKKKKKEIKKGPRLSTHSEL